MQLDRSCDLGLGRPGDEASVAITLSPYSSLLVQDVAFQLERLVAGMYIYQRQCYKVLKPAAVFPIEVELGIIPPMPQATPASEPEAVSDELLHYE